MTLAAVADLPADHQIGANGPPADPYDAHAANVDDLYTEALNWADGEPIETDAQLSEVERLIDDVKAAIDACVASRDEAKAPHQAKVNALQEQYYPLIGETKKVTGKAILAKEKLLEVKTLYATKKAAEQAAEAARLQQLADEKAAAAREAHQASVGDLAASEAAEDLFRDAQKTAAAATKAAKPAVKGMRNNWVIKGFQPWTGEDGVEVQGPTAMLRHYFKTRPTELIEACLDMARADVRGGTRTIPGVVIENDRRAV